ncbi:DoxX [Pseudomonas psychrotolerans L19]|uniref:DoxX family protein n=1 Tax=Pseudomonas TaxID=286 RepID=UPI00023A5ACD|nr:MULTISPECIES: DoxX family protein [Pseudomonas]EHK69953.1 DoxX [Pseudomonas psychrotolerans L19]MBA1182346.1 DoxX family protein [Pseudomonas psychrotolerans]MBA1210927.1 DoxX family protein [Pseudomonas psychrotolerans]OYT80330.1 MAG: LysR family transcriptional regulator [Pseudomonas sp. PGPPP4]TCQ88559.1 putative oxidoreductase [Pseudomonas sp. JUb52]
MERVRLDLGLLFLRLGGAGLLLAVHGLPKALHFRQQLGLIEDPLHLGAWPTLGFAVFAEVLCPLLIALGWATRLACLPILGLLLIALLVVHPQWSLEEGQFGWLLLVLFGTLALTGPGRYSLEARLARRHAAQGGFARALS